MTLRGVYETKNNYFANARNVCVIFFLLLDCSRQVLVLDLTFLYANTQKMEEKKSTFSGSPDFFLFISQGVIQETA